MSYPICPINQIGIRHPVMCSDGYMYEEKCIKEWIETGKITSPINRQIIEFVKSYNISDKCFNDFGGEVLKMIMKKLTIIIQKI